MIAAIVPAAGRSERMGRPKLILPVGGLSVIAHVTDALRRGGADPVVVVVPPAAVPGASALAAEAARAGGCVVVAEPPPADMRASVERGLDHVAQMAIPPRAAFLLAPADSPGISAELVARIIARAEAEPDAIVIPQAQGRRGHPIALPWSLAAEIRGLPGDVGINALVARHAARVVTLDVADPTALADLDTPDDYRRWTTPLRDPGREGMDAAQSSHDDESSVPAGTRPGQSEEQRVRVTVRLFALARQRAGQTDVALDVPAPATVAAVKRALVATFPDLAPLVPQLMIAIDSDYAGDDQRLIPPGAEVAAIPPVSGGRP
jgi:molybdenum cofactor cytidylyltransferase